jgi:dipeptidyl aminopeptidase/acylaminoacyl peptidase
MGSYLNLLHSLKTHSVTLLSSAAKPWVKTSTIGLLALALGACTAATDSSSPALDANLNSVTPAASVTSERVTNGNVVSQGLPEVPAALVQDMQRYRNTRSASFAGFIDGQLLVKTRFGETRQLHRVAGPGQARAQFTFFAEPIGEVALPKPKAHADANGFIFTKDVGGSEFYQLFSYDLATGQHKMLSDGESRYSSVLFSNQGAEFAYTSTERDSVHFDIYVRTRNSEPRRVITSDGGSWVALDWSADDSRLLVLKYISRNISYLYEVDVASGEKTLIAGGDDTTFVGGAVYAPGSNDIYYLSDIQRQFSTLHRLDRASGQSEAISADIPWSVEGLVRAPVGELLAFSVNDDGLSTLYLLNTETGERRAVKSLPASMIGNMEFAPDAQQLALTLSRPTRPTDVYTLDVSGWDVSGWDNSNWGGGELEQWTSSEVGGLDVEAFVEPQLIRYPSFDALDGKPRSIPAFVFSPKTPGPHPVLILIHGGPEAQYRPRFSATIQYYVNELGLTVIAPNVRGSAGYGKDYLKLDNGMLREDSVKDIGALLDWIGVQPQLDASKVVVYGGSYGGYMVLASMVNYPTRIAAGVDVVGISDFVTFLENTQPYRQDLRRVEYGDERKPEMRAYLEKIAPLRQVNKIQRPLLVAQGFNDPRVPASESEQIVSALNAADVPVWYLLFMDEGHGFRKKSNSDLASAAYVMFLQKFVL